MKFLLVLILAGLLGPTSPTQINSTVPANHFLPAHLSAVPQTPVPVKLLRDDPLLQAPVTVDAVEQPLGDVLAGLNRTMKLDLTAERNVADQRVTLHVAGQPVYVLMNHLLLLLSHDSQHPYGYHWGSLDRAKGERPDYQLWRDMASAVQEEEARDYPHRELGVFLRDLRHIAQLPPRELLSYRGDYPYKNPDPDDAFNKAFRGLTDDQIDALVNGEVIPLDPLLFAEDIAAYKQDPNPGFVYGDDPAIRVFPTEKENDRDEPEKIGSFSVHLDGIRGDSIVLDTHDTMESRDPERLFLNLPADTGPKVDLSPYLASKIATPQQKADLGFNLQALGSAAHLNIYGESFLPSSVHNIFPPPGLTTLQASVPRLVAQICAVWNYHAEPVPGGYLFWSRTWAQKRASDVPERLIAPWRQRLKKNGVLGPYDRAEIAASLTWPQVALTVNPALFPDSDSWTSIYNYKELNLFGNLAPSEQAQTLSPDGLAVSEMSARGQAALGSDFQKQLVNIPGDQLMQSVLHFRTEEAPELNVLRLIMEVDANGQRLLETRCVMPLQAGEIGKPAK